MLKFFRFSILFLFFTIVLQVFTFPSFAEDLEANCTGDECTSASGQVCGNNGIQITLGCISTDPKDLFALGIRIGSSIGGGLALLFMIIGSFKMLTSSGDVEKLREGKSQFTSATVGLIFIILSVTILQIVGVDILNLPGFTR